MQYNRHYLFGKLPNKGSTAGTLSASIHIIIYKVINYLPINITNTLFLNSLNTILLTWTKLSAREFMNLCDSNTSK